MFIKPKLILHGMLPLTAGTILMRDAFGPVATVVGEVVNNSLSASDFVGTAVNVNDSFDSFCDRKQEQYYFIINI